MCQVREEILPFFFYFTFHSGLLQLSELKTGLINLEYKNIPQVYRWQNFFLCTWNSPGPEKNLGQMEKWLKRLHRASNWHCASRLKENTSWSSCCRGKLGTARAHSLNSLSLCWPSTSTLSSAPDRHQHSLPGSCNARHGHWAWDVQHHHSQSDTLLPCAC